MRKCRFEKQLVDYFFGELKPERKSIVEEHLRKCEGCRGWIDAAYKISSMYSKIDLDEPNLRSKILDGIPLKQRCFRKRLLSYSLMTGIAFAAICGIGLFQKTTDIVTHFRLYRDLEVISCLDRIGPLVGQNAEAPND
jgi:predicted anti-sigma-YlaC factor YlaD